MTDIFISYSRRHAQPTEELARDLEAEGFTTWWDTKGLNPGDDFPEKIEREINAAQVAIVIWTDDAVGSNWVRAEASHAYELGKLITLHADGFDLRRVPMLFRQTLQSSPVTDRAKIFEALNERGVRPSRGATPSTVRPPPPPEFQPTNKTSKGTTDSALYPAADKEWRRRWRKKIIAITHWAAAVLVVGFWILLGLYFGDIKIWVISAIICVFYFRALWHSYDEKM